MPHLKTGAKAQIARCRAVMTGLSRAGTKAAELGGDGNDVQFEQAFSNLAHAYLADKAPSLLQYELGFQLLDRNQDNTKAVGIFGFKVGPKLMYGPAFFLNGDLKGHELLYLKDEDQFVPLKENWLNHLLNKRPNVLGGGVPTDPARLGVSQPDLHSMNFPPTKYAGAVRPALLPGAAAFAHCATTNPFTDPKYAGVTDLAGFLKKEGAVVVRAFVTMLAATPALAEKFASTFDGMRIIREAVEATRTAPARPTGVLPGGAEKTAGTWALGDEPLHKAQAPSTDNGAIPTHGHAAWASTAGRMRKGVATASAQHMKTAASGCYTVDAAGKLRPKYTPKAHRPAGVLSADVTVGTAQTKAAALRVVTLADFDPASDLSPDGREALLRDGVVFFDKRAEADVSAAYRESTLALTNPDQSGVYDVLVKPGRFERCAVLFGPYSEDGRQDFATLVRLDGERTYLNTHPSRLWVRQKPEGSQEGYAAWFAALPAADSLPAGRSAVHVLVGPGGQASCPFRVEEELSPGGEVKVYAVWFKDYGSGTSRAGNLPPLRDRDRGADRTFSSYGERITLTGKAGGELVADGTDLFVPAGFRLLTVRPDRAPADPMGECCGPSEGSDPPPIVPGSNADLERVLFSATTAMKVAHTGSEVQIGAARLSPLDALVYLVRDVGLREKAARDILAEARARRVTRCRVKLAAPYGVDPMTTGPGPSAPPFPDQPPAGLPVPGAQSVAPLEADVPVGLPAGQPADPYAPDPDPYAAQQVMQAAQTGQKEVLDTAAIGSILKAVRDDTMIDRHLGDLMKGLDRLGRILFSFYWHGEEFQDRYGKQDMPELEDGLRNSFESLGDTVLFLKQKTVEPFPDEMAHADLHQAAA